MNIPFRVKLLTSTAKAPHKNCESDLWDLFADDFCGQNLQEKEAMFYGNGYKDSFTLSPKGRILVKTGIAIELPKQYNKIWSFDNEFEEQELVSYLATAYAVADIRPRSGLALKHGITVLNTPGTIDNSYRKEIGVILINHGHEPYTINKNDKIAQMLIRPLYPSSLEIVKDFKDTGRGGYNSTGY